MITLRSFTKLTVKSGVNLFQRCQAHVGWIGLGYMGTPMATHLINKGNSLVVYDINKEACDKFAAKGAKVASNPAEVAAQCDRVFTMVPADPYVIEVFSGTNGLLSKASKETILMDCSTVHPNTSKRLLQLCTEAGVDFLDTPVAGAVPAANAGTLTFMVGGRADLIPKVEPLLLCMGRRVIHCGDTGAGSAAKICNNMMLAISMMGTSETLILAQSLGLDVKMMTEILNISSGRTWVSDTYNPVPGVMENVPSARDYQPGFKIELLAKDLSISQSCASATDAPTPMGALALAFYKAMTNNGLGAKDFSYAYQFMLKKVPGGVRKS